VSPLVRVATARDLIARIYGYAVESSVATFDVADPPVAYWQHKLASAEAGDHMLVVEDAASVVGFAYSTSFRPRSGYFRTRETSIYLAPDAVGHGLGRMTYSHLLSLLRADQVHTAMAVVAEPNPASVALHESLGFELVGTLREVGRKFDRWVDTRWYQLILEP
jgi:L-amino acid N-acyltransferase YncA